MLAFDENELQWAEDIFRKIDAKMEKTLPRTKCVIPYRVENGRFENMAEKTSAGGPTAFGKGCCGCCTVAQASKPTAKPRSRGKPFWMELSGTIPGCTMMWDFCGSCPQDWITS